MRKSAFGILLLLCVLGLAGSIGAQSGVRAVVVNEFANVRVAPAIGAEVIATVPAGYVFDIVTGRSGDTQWLRVQFNGEEGWVNLTPLVVLEGDLNGLQVGDPRTIPYGGFDAPRSGQTTADSPNRVRVTNNLRVRAGPGTAYPTLANMFAGTEVPVFGRTASNRWIQVNFEGTLGWASVSFVQFLNGLSLASLPIDGIVADSPPISDRTAIDFFDTLRLMLSRLDLAQPSLDNIRGKWTDAALNGRATCRDYPARPSNYNVPVPVLAANFPILDPLQRDFNDAMTNLRRAIDLFIEVCNQPGSGNPVGEATVIGALEIVNVVDSQFADLRARLLELIPADLEPGPNECLFVFNNRAEILPLITIGEIRRITFSPTDRASGFCFDTLAGQVLALQSLIIRGGPEPLVAVSPFDNPTDFLAVGTQSPATPLFTLSPIRITAGGRYLALAFDQSFSFDGEIAIAITNLPETGLTEILTYNEEEDRVFFAFPGQATPTPFGATGGTSPNASCPSVAFTCEQLFTCQEAYACLAQGNTGLDPDGDGIPCENLCSP